MTRVAAIDCGTNSIRLLVADLDPEAGTQADLERRMEIMRLGEGVDRTGALAPQAVERTLAVCEAYAAECARWRVERIRFCATSAARDATGGDVFARGVRDRVGVDAEVITGADEAVLTYTGSTRELESLGLPAPYLVLDIGGGSTELVLGSSPGEVSVVRSLDIGSVRMTERHLHDDPPTRAQVEAAVVDIERALDESGVPFPQAQTLVGVAGTVTTVAAMVLDLPHYDPARIHHSRLPLIGVRSATDELLAMTHAARAELPFMHPGRADVIGAGALLLDRVCRRVQDTLAKPEILVSEHDILDGIAWTLV